MKKSVLMTILLLLISGCASFRESETGLKKRLNQLNSLASVNGLLESGDRDGAVKALTAVIDGDGTPGTTDEALFRLALLKISPAPERDSNLQAVQLLTRLKKEYPASPWTFQSGQLLELLSGVDEMRRQAKNLKSQNQALTGEVNELNRNIDQLKKLDQELEKRRH